MVRNHVWNQSQLKKPKVKCHTCVCVFSVKCQHLIWCGPVLSVHRSCLLERVCRLSKGRDTDSDPRGRSGNFCARRKSQTRPETRNFCSPECIGSSSVPAKSRMSSYNSARWHLHRRRLRCRFLVFMWFPNNLGLPTVPHKNAEGAITLPAVWWMER